MRTLSKLLLVALLCAVLRASAEPGSDLLPVYALGAGVGTSTTRGDFIQDKTIDVVAINRDLENNSTFLILRGITATDNEASGLSILTGLGWRHFKFGTGLVRQTTTVPTANNIDFMGLFTTDTGKDTTVSVTTIPLYIRIRPIVTSTWLVILDGYYGLYSKGSMRVPIQAGGLDGYIDTEPQSAGGTKGVNAALAWRPSAISKWALRLDYTIGQGAMDRNLTHYQGDIFGLLGKAQVPDIQFTNRTAILSFALAI